MMAPYWGLGQLLDIDDEQARDDLARVSVTAMSFVAQSARGLGLPAVPQREIDKAKTIVERFMIRWRGEPDPRPRQGGRRLLRLRGRARHERLDVHRPGRRLHRRRRGRRDLRPRSARCPARCTAARRPGCCKMLDEVERSGDPVGYVKGLLDREERLMGFGHRVYRAEDPRARTLRRTAQELGSRRVEVAEALEKAAIEELTARYPDRPLRTNVEFWSAVVLDFAEVPPHMFTSMFTCARTAGWSAHIMEQKRLNKLIRPSARYVGPGPRRPEDVDGLGRDAPGRRRHVTGRRRRSRPWRGDLSSDRAARRDQAPRRPLRLRALQGAPGGAGVAGLRRGRGDGHVPPPGAGEGPGRTGPGPVWPAVRPARRVRGRARQRRRDRVLGRGGVRAGPGAVRAPRPSASSARSSPT